MTPRQAMKILYKHGQVFGDWRECYRLLVARLSGYQPTTVTYKLLAEQKECQAAVDRLGLGVKVGF